MKKVRIIHFAALALTLIILVVNKLGVPLPDWAVRTNGVVMLVALAVAAYCTVKGSAER